MTGWTCGTCGDGDMDALQIVDDGDFVIGRYRLSKHLGLELADRPEFGGEAHGDLSVLSAMVPKRQRQVYARELSLVEAVSLPSGRVPLYICFCGDLACGALSVSISRSGDHIHWTDFGSESNWEKGFSQTDHMKRTGPFTFDRSAYLNAISSYR